MTTCQAYNDPWKHFDIDNRWKTDEWRASKVELRSFLFPVTGKTTIFLAEFLYVSPLRATFYFSSLHPAWWFGACGSGLNGSFSTLRKFLPMLSHLSSFRVYGVLSSYVDGWRAFIPGGLVELEGTLPVASATSPARVAPSQGMPQRPFNK